MAGPSEARREAAPAAPCAVAGAARGPGRVPGVAAAVATHLTDLEILRRLETSPRGLAGEEAERRWAACGDNSAPPVTPISTISTWRRAGSLHGGHGAARRGVGGDGGAGHRGGAGTAGMYGMRAASGWRAAGQAVRGAGRRSALAGGREHRPEARAGRRPTTGGRVASRRRPSPGIQKRMRGPAGPLAQDRCPAATRLRREPRAGRRADL